MSVETAYSITTDFGGTPPNEFQLHQEIVAANPLPTAVFEGLLVGQDLAGTVDTDRVTVLTTNAVPGGEKTALDVVIAAHPASTAPTLSTAVQNNFAATTAPGVGDDASKGYVIGSKWVDQTADKEYVCLDNTIGAAVWKETTVPAGSGDVVGPGSATDGAVALYDGTTGKLLKDGPVPGAASGLATLDGSSEVPDAQIPSTITRDSELTTHAGLASVHHTKYTDGEAVTAMGAKGAGNPLNHDLYSHPNHTGDVTSSGDGAQTIANDAVTNAKLANMAAYTLKLRNAGTTGDPTDVKISALTDEPSPAAGDFLLLELASGELRKADIDNLPGFPSYLFYADQFDNPNNADWAVTSLAPAEVDPDNNALTVRAFDDGTDEGVGMIFEVPTGATNIVFDFKSRAQTAPGGAVGVVPALYVREIPDNAAVEAWGSEFDMTALSFPTNEFYQYDTQTIALTALSMVAGRTVQIELIRNVSAAGDDLIDDWYLLELKVSFT